MCGITGFNWADEKLIRKMSSEIAHRGPNDSGTYVDKGVSLGHQRLSILDLSPKGHQPMFNERGDVVVVFNGEIWNFLELRSELEKQGHRFASTSDTEVLVHGYESWGEELCSKIEGMFAFALWDRKKKKLLLARDGIGKKPLYYYLHKGRFIFASEIKAILAEESVPRNIDEQCLAEYLTLRFSPGTMTMFADIKKLPPGSYSVLQNGELRLKRYWKMPAFVKTREPSAEEVDALIANAVKKRLMSDVPLGVFLSGGLDSSALVAYMSRFRDKIKTFSVGFGEKNDETRYARIIAEKFKTDHTEIMLDKESLDVLPAIVWHFDEPLADPAALPTYHLCEQVGKKVRVALSGEGGDEVFGGYQTFNSVDKLMQVQKIPRFLRHNVIRPGFKAAAPFLGYPYKQMAYLGAEVAKDIDNLPETYKKLFYFPFDSKDKMRLLLSTVRSKVSLGSAIDRCLEGKDLKHGSMNYYFNEWLPNDLLMKADKMAMAHGLEVRTPFLDKDLIAYFAGIDNVHKHERSIFRETIGKLLPAEIMNKKKQGFTLPLAHWFAKKEFSERLMPQFDDLKRRGIFEEKELKKIIDNPKDFRNDHRLWVLLNFELWHKIYLDKQDYRELKL